MEFWRGLQALEERRKEWSVYALRWRPEPTDTITALILLAVLRGVKHLYEVEEVGLWRSLYHFHRELLYPSI